MSEAFTYQVSDLDTFVSEPRYAYADIEDIEELAVELEYSLLSEQPFLDNSGLVLVIGDAGGMPLHFHPIGKIH
jgi:hypothetical protein